MKVRIDRMRIIEIFQVEMKEKKFSKFAIATFEKIYFKQIEDIEFKLLLRLAQELQVDFEDIVLK